MAGSTARRVGLAILTILGVTGITEAKDNGLAITPQMGWDNWNAFGCSVSDELMTQTANLIVNYGLRDLGYKYVIMDDCWSAGRNASNNNSLIADPEKFPRGIPALADEIHELGLGWGMYSSAGSLTCAGFAGSLGFEEVDAQTWADWGVDYLKYDNCYNEGQAGNQLISRNRYNVMSTALNATGRPILYSLCNWGEDFTWNWGSTIANSWRISGDVFDYWNTGDTRCPCDGDSGWDCELPGFHCSVMNIANKVSGIVSKSVPGGWNDMDMLEVGNGGMTDSEYVAHFSLWSAAKSPLIMGNDLRSIIPTDLAILSNPAVIAINQDPLSQSAVRRSLQYFPTDTATFLSNGMYPSAQPLLQTWAGPLVTTTNSTAGMDMVLLFINSLDTPTTMNITLADLFIDNGPSGTASQVKLGWEIRDLWSAFNRMSESEAASIINGTNNGTIAVQQTEGNNNQTETIQLPLFNITQQTYGEAVLAANSSSVPGMMEMMLGQVVGTVEPMGTVSADVAAHGSRMFRLRATGGPALRKRDEL